MTIDIKKLRELEAAATGGPWAIRDEHEIRTQAPKLKGTSKWGPLVGEFKLSECGVPQVRAENLSLIVAMRNALPDLLRHIEMVEHQRDELRRRWKEAQFVMFDRKKDVALEELWMLSQVALAGIETSLMDLRAMAIKNKPIRCED